MNMNNDIRIIFDHTQPGIDRLIDELIEKEDSFSLIKDTPSPTSYSIAKVTVIYNNKTVQTPPQITHHFELKTINLSVKTPQSTEITQTTECIQTTQFIQTTVSRETAQSIETSISRRKFLLALEPEEKIKEIILKETVEEYEKYSIPPKAELNENFQLIFTLLTSTDEIEIKQTTKEFMLAQVADHNFSKILEQPLESCDYAVFTFFKEIILNSPWLFKCILNNPTNPFSAMIIKTALNTQLKEILNEKNRILRIKNILKDSIQALKKIISSSCENLTSSTQTIKCVIILKNEEKEKTITLDTKMKAQKE